jgi:hypothetical protein
MTNPVQAPDRVKPTSPVNQAGGRPTLRPLVPTDSRLFGGWGIRF